MDINVAVNVGQAGGPGAVDEAIDLSAQRLEGCHNVGQKVVLLLAVLLLDFRRHSQLEGDGQLLGLRLPRVARVQSRHRLVRRFRGTLKYRPRDYVSTLIRQSLLCADPIILKTIEVRRKINF